MKTRFLGEAPKFFSFFVSLRTIAVLIAMLWANLGFALPGSYDFFTNSIYLSSTNINTFGSNAGATSEDGEPSLGPDAAGKTVWWQWTSSAYGTVSVNQQSGPVPHIFGIYTGNTVSNLNLIAVGTNVSFSAVPGVVYRIAADGIAGPLSEGSFILHLECFNQPPPNDNFSNAFVLTGTNSTVNTSTIMATAELGEPSFGASSLGATVWWSWTAPANGVFYTGNPSRVVAFSVFTGTDVGALTLVTNGPSVFIRVSGGTTYSIGVDAVSGYGGGQGLVNFDFHFKAAPPNDMFADRTILSGLHIDVTGSTTLATREEGEPLHGFSSLFDKYSIWWNWTAPSNGAVAIKASTASLDSMVVYVGDTLGSLRKVAQVNEGQINFAATAGTTYQIAASTDYYHDLSLKLDWSETASNDFFSNRVTLTGTNILINAPNTNATTEVDEPVAVDADGFKWFQKSSLWWTWTAPVYGTATIDLSASTPYDSGIFVPIFVPMVTVYTGDSLTNLSQVAYGNGFDVNPLQFPVKAGQVYQIEVGSMPTFRLNTGTIVMHLSAVPSPPPSNDLFKHRIPLTGTNVVVSGSNINATLEPGDDGYPTNTLDQSSVWWRWTAPLTGDATVEVDSPTRQLIEVFTGNSLETLAVVGTGLGPDHIPATFHAVAGTSYQISIASSAPEEFILHLTEDVLPLNRLQVTPTIQAIRVGDSVQFKVTDSGELPLVYQWQLNGIDLPGETGDILTVKSAALNSHGDYTVKVMDANHDSISLRAKLVVLIPPSNDNFAHPLVLSGSDVRASGSTVGATFEPGEYAAWLPKQTGGSVWWIWTAPYTGEATIDTGGSDYSPSLDVSTGDSISTPRYLAATYSGRTVSFPVSKGTNYRIRFGGNFEGGENIRFHLLRNQSPAPRIIEHPLTQTVNIGETASFSASAVSGLRLHYQWRHNGNVIPGATGATLSLRRVTKASFGNYDVVVSDGVVSATSLPARLNFRSPPINDDFAHAKFLSGLVARSTGTLRSATAEPGEPLEIPSVWWKWTAPVDGEVVLAIYGPHPNAKLTVYTGDTVDALTDIASQAEPADYDHEDYRDYQILAFNAIAKTVYYIQVADSSFGNSFTLSLVENNSDRKPTFFAQPDNRAVFVGDDVTWSIPVFGREPMRYQWQFNGKNLRGETNATLTIHGAKLTSSGRYRLLARNAAGVAVSQPAIVSVSQPTGTTSSPGRAKGLNPTTATLSEQSNDSFLHNRALLPPSVTELKTDVISDWRMIGSADFNGDGEPDRLWQHVSGILYVSFMDGQECVGGAYLFGGNPIDGRWHVVGIADPKDGKIGLLLKDDEGAVRVELLNDTEFTEDLIDRR